VRIDLEVEVGSGRGKWGGSEVEIGFGAERVMPVVWEGSSINNFCRKVNEFFTLGYNYIPILLRSFREAGPHFKLIPQSSR
jgi:hypothetical protein